MISKNKNNLPLSAEVIVDKVLSAHRELSYFESMIPNARLDSIVYALLDIFRPSYDLLTVEKVLQNPAIVKRLFDIQSCMGNHEFELEKLWSDKIAAKEAHYSDFPAIDKYNSLVATEIDVLKTLTSIENKKVCFMGSGPLPLTAFALKQIYKSIDLYCIEMDHDAIEQSKRMCAASEVEMNYIHSKGEECDYSPYDLIFVASMTINRNRVFRQISETAECGAIVGARTVEQLRKLIYEPVDEANMPSVFCYKDKTPFKELHFNTTLFFEIVA